ncbi:MAG: hypothetical protein HY741_02060 [Chloroflexi bacterium]|nr:hypothetical protein [Chloroflexota bacterium]
MAQRSKSISVSLFVLCTLSIGIAVWSWSSPSSPASAGGLPCFLCHGIRAEGSDIAPRLAGTELTDEQIFAQVRTPRGVMPAYPDYAQSFVVGWIRQSPIGQPTMTLSAKQRSSALAMIAAAAAARATDAKKSASLPISPTPTAHPSVTSSSSPRVTPTGIAARAPAPPPTALPQTLGKHPVYVLDVRNGGLISELIGIDPDVRKSISALPLRYAPEVIFSPSGEKMYVWDTYYTRVTRGEWHDVLSVFDAKTLGLETDNVPVPDRLRYKLFPVGDLWTFVSPDGAQLFVGKYGKSDIHALRLTVLDATTFAQTAEYSFPACDDNRVHVLKNRRLLCLNGGNLNLIASLTGQATTLVKLAPRGTQTTFLSPERDRWYHLDREGHVTVVDIAASPPRILVENQQLEVPPQHAPGWAHQTVMTQDGARLYLGLVPTSGEGFGAGVVDVIRVYDTQTWKLVGEVKPRDPAQYIALSRDGTQLYMTNAEKKTFAIYDALRLSELGVMREVGISPSQILIPPN